MRLHFLYDFSFGHALMWATNKIVMKDKCVCGGGASNKEFRMSLPWTSKIHINVYHPSYLLLNLTPIINILLRLTLNGSNTQFYRSPEPIMLESDMNQQPYLDNRQSYHPRELTTMKSETMLTIFTANKSPIVK